MFLHTSMLDSAERGEKGKEQPQPIPTEMKNDGSMDEETVKTQSVQKETVIGENMDDMDEDKINQSVPDEIYICENMGEQQGRAQRKTSYPLTNAPNKPIAQSLLAHEVKQDEITETEKLDVSKKNPGMMEIGGYETRAEDDPPQILDTLKTLRQKFIKDLYQVIVLEQVTEIMMESAPP